MLKTTTRQLALILGVCTSTLLVGCASSDSIPEVERRAIADSLSSLVVHAYDFSRPDPTTNLLSLYPDSGRVISAAAGRVTTTRTALESEIHGFWERVGQRMKGATFILGSTWVDVITRDAAVMTLTYSIPHTTPQNTPHIIEGAWTMLWRRQHGKWRIVQEHLSDTPESTAPGPSQVPSPAPGS